MMLDSAGLFSRQRLKSSPEPPGFGTTSASIIPAADLLFEVGAEQSKGSSGAAGGRGGLLSGFHGSLRSSLVIVRDARRHSHRYTTCTRNKFILGSCDGETGLRFRNVSLSQKTFHQRKTSPRFRTSFYTQKRKREVDKAVSHDRP